MKKQQTIINAAINEFVRHGFDNASTNNIVKAADISKGSLFNYFNSKKDLYLFLMNYSNEIIEGLYEIVDFNETDIFKRIKEIGFEKFQIQMKYPKVFDFLLSMVQEESSEVVEEIEQIVDDIYGRGSKQIYKNIDYSKFRDDIDPQKAIEILNWTMFGFGEKGMQEIKSFENIKDFGEQYLHEWQLYADILENSFYK